MVLAAPISTERVLWRRRKARRSSSSELGTGPSVVTCERLLALLQDRSVRGVREPLVRDRLQRAVLAQCVDGGGHVRGEGAVLLEHEAELVAALSVRLRQLADDDAAVQLDPG